MGIPSEIKSRNNYGYSHQAGNYAELVSVIVPVYNTEKYLPQCIESILSQTYRNLELLLITEPCNDNSEDICDRAAWKDSRIRVFHKPELSGVSRSRNIGLEQAKGTLLLFVDSDDYIEPEMIKRMIWARNSLHADIVKCGTKILENNTLTPKKKNAPFYINLAFPDAMRFIIGCPGDNRFAGEIGSVLIPVPDTVSGDGKRIFFSEKLNYSEDVHWLVRVFMNSKSVLFMEDTPYIYRKYREGNTFSEMYRNNSLKYCDSAILSYKEMYAQLRENKVECWNNAYRRMVAHQLRARKKAAEIGDKGAYRKYSKGLPEMLLRHAIQGHTLRTVAWSGLSFLRYIGTSWIYRGKTGDE